MESRMTSLFILIMLVPICYMIRREYKAYKSIKKRLDRYDK